ncbi:hypothetical protein ACTA71_005722 [Dictyostelium dimigraforme]
MRLLLAILFVLCFSRTILSSIWSKCGDYSTDKLQIENVIITPDVPVKGEQITVTVSGILTEDVTGGTASITVRYGFITLLNKEYDICSSEDPIPCPIDAGSYQKTITETIPASAPPGSYTGNFVLKDQEGNRITCINFDLHL